MPTKKKACTNAHAGCCEPEETPKPVILPNLTIQQCADLALKIHRGEVFTDWDCANAAEIIQSFPILRMMHQKDAENLCKQAGLFYEDFARRGPLGINGRPMFFSLRAVNKESAEKVRIMLKDIMLSEKQTMSKLTKEFKLPKGRTLAEVASKSTEKTLRTKKKVTPAFFENDRGQIKAKKKAPKRKTA